MTAAAASGNRSFSPADMERLCYILAAQRDLPLRVIKEHRAALDRDHRTLPQHPGASECGKTAWMSRVPPPASTSEPLVKLEFDRPGPGGGYGAGAVTVARSTRALEEFGLHALLVKTGLRRVVDG